MIELLDIIKAYLNKCFSMKDLGEAAYILGIKIKTPHWSFTEYIP